MVTSRGVSGTANGAETTSTEASSALAIRRSRHRVPPGTEPVARSMLPSVPLEKPTGCQVAPSSAE
jgi:hypothetical protein